MARVAGVELPKNKRMEIALTYIYGIGRSSASSILAKAKVDPNRKTDDLSAEEISHIFERTAEFERTPPGPLLAGKACANMFFEESTRTFTSFHLAELRLGADVVNLAPKLAEVWHGYSGSR